MAINDKTVPSVIKRLSRSANFVLLCLITIAISEYSIVFSQFKENAKNFTIIDLSYKRTSEISKVCFLVRSLTLINSSILTNYLAFNTKEDYITSIKADMKKSLENLYNI